MRDHVWVVVCLSAAVFLASEAAVGVTPYAIRDLGTLGGSSSCSSSLNEDGLVVGWARDANDHMRPFLWQSGVMTDLGTFGGPNGQASEINGLGQTVGYGEDSAGNRRAFLWLAEPAYGLPAGLNDLGTLGGSYSVAVAISDSGQIVGYSENAAGEHVPFLWQNGAMSQLPTLGGSGNHSAYDVNGSCSVVGESYVTGSTYHAFLYQDGSTTDLGTISGGVSCGYGVDNLGEVVGYSGGSIWSGGAHAFFWLPLGDYGLPAGMNDLGPGEAFGVNDLGQVVGIDGEGRAFVWENGVRNDLNDLILGDPGWSLSYAQDITNGGLMAGYGTDPDGQQHAFLLTPIPEPGTCALVSLGVLGLLWRRRAS